MTSVMVQREDGFWVTVTVTVVGPPGGVVVDWVPPTPLPTGPVQVPLMVKCEDCA